MRQRSNKGRARERLQSLQRYALPWSPLALIRSPSNLLSLASAEAAPGRCSIATSEPVLPPMSSNAFFHRPPFRQPRDKKSRSTSRRRSAACMDIASDGSRHFGVHFVHLTCNEDASSICKNRPVPARVRLPVSVGFSAECERDVRFGSKAVTKESCLAAVPFIEQAFLGTFQKSHKEFQCPNFFRV